MKMTLAAAASASLLFAAISALAQPLSPLTPKIPVTNTYFNTRLVDNYQRLENFEDPAVKKWNQEENHLSRAYLGSLPSRASIAARLQTLYTGGSASYTGAHRRRSGRIRLRL
jgi:prolyl oligopeptidase